MSEAHKYFMGEGAVGRVARKQAIPVLSPETQVGMRITVREGPGISPIIRPGLLCYSATQTVRGSANTFVATPDGDLTIDHANDVEYAYDFTVGEDDGQIPTETVAVIAICYILNASEPMFLEMGGEPISLVVGPRIKRTEDITAEHAAVLEEIVFPNEDGESAVVSIRQALLNAAALILDARAILYGDAEADPPVPTLDARITSGVQAEVDPDGETATGELLDALRLAALGDGGTPATITSAYTSLVNGIVGPSGSLTSAFNSLKSAVEHADTGLGARALSSDVTEAFSELEFASVESVEALEAAVDIGETYTLQQIAQAVAQADGDGIAQLGITATGGGAVANLSISAQTSGGVSYSQVGIVADGFSFRSLTGGGFYASGQSLRTTVPIIMESTDEATWKITGVDFGASSDLLEWFGPNIGDIDACTKENGYEAKTNDGQIWQYGERIGASAITTYSSTPSIGTIADTGIGTNGNTKSVIGGVTSTATKSATFAGDSLTAGVTTYSAGWVNCTAAYRETGGAWGSFTASGNVAGTVTKTITNNYSGIETIDSQTVTEVWNAAANSSGTFAAVSGTYEARNISSYSVPSGFGSIVSKTTISTSETA